FHVTGVQTCALPISARAIRPVSSGNEDDGTGDAALVVTRDEPDSHTVRSCSAAAGTTAATAPAGDRALAGRGPATERDRGEQLHRVVVPLRAVGRFAGRAHGTVHFEGVTAGAAAKLVARHGTTIR